MKTKIAIALLSSFAILLGANEVPADQYRFLGRSPPSLGEIAPRTLSDTGPEAAEEEDSSTYVVPPPGEREPLEA